MQIWKRPMLLGLLFTVISFIIFVFVQKWNGIGLAIKPDELVARMSPLILASTFVERAVEILISPWRDGGANLLDRAVTAIKARPTDPTTPIQNAQNAADLAVASAALDAYRSETQRYAFAVGLILSFFAAAVGVRALYPFVVDLDAFKNATGNLKSQVDFFRDYDVALTTALLAGGADGMHAIISSITSFFQKAGDNSK